MARWTGHVGRMTDEKCIQNLVEKNLKGIDQLGELVEGTWITLKYILKKDGMSL